MKCVIVEFFDSDFTAGTQCIKPFPLPPGLYNLAFAAFGYATPGVTDVSTNVGIGLRLSNIPSSLSLQLPAYAAPGIVNMGFGAATLPGIGNACSWSNGIQADLSAPYTGTFTIELFFYYEEL